MLISSLIELTVIYSFFDYSVFGLQSCEAAKADKCSAVRARNKENGGADQGPEGTDDQREGGQRVS